MTLMAENLKELVEGLVQEVLGKFNFQMFKQIAAGDVRPPSSRNPHAYINTGETPREHPEIAYAKKMLPLLGEGSSRIVFAYSGGKALKIAMNRAGLEQNNEEVNAYTKHKNLSIIPKIFDAASDNKWIVAEIVKPFTSGDDFQRVVGANFESVLTLVASDPRAKLEQVINNIKYDLNDPYITNRDFYVKEMEDLKKLLKNQKAKSAIDQLSKMLATGSSKGDMHVEHFGTNVQGELKYFDYGLTEDIFQNYYSNHRGRSFEDAQDQDFYFGPDPTGSEF